MTMMMTAMASFSFILAASLSSSIACFLLGRYLELLTQPLSLALDVLHLW